MLVFLKIKRRYLMNDPHIQRVAESKYSVAFLAFLAWIR